MRGLVVGLMMIALTACVGQPESPYVAPSASESITLRVNNYSGGHLKVRANGRLIGTVDQSRNCIVIGQSYYQDGRLSIVIDPSGGDDEFLLPPIDPYTSQGWEVTVEMWTVNRYNQAISLRPAPRCDVD